MFLCKFRYDVSKTPFFEQQKTAVLHIFYLILLLHFFYENLLKYGSEKVKYCAQEEFTEELTKELTA